VAHLLPRADAAGRALEADLCEALLLHEWPLNVRGLLNVLSIAVISSDDDGPLALTPEVEMALVELYRAGSRSVPIFYSLGNFLFKQFDAWTDRGLAVRITARDGGGLDVEYLPVAVDYQPRFLASAEGAPLIARLEGLSGGVLQARPN
jgi:transcriptional regulator of acetoin/glycerol metabolism